MSPGRLHATVLHARSRQTHGTLNCTLLCSVPLGVTTETKPVVAPLGTVVVISVLETTVNAALAAWAEAAVL